MRGIAIRDELTNEWKKRGVKEHLEYAILTAEISRATFGMTPSEYKDFKALDKQRDNLRDHMNDLELIFTMLGEASTTEIARNKDAQGFDRNQVAAVEGGTLVANWSRNRGGGSAAGITSRKFRKLLKRDRLSQQMELVSNRAAVCLGSFQHKLAIFEVWHRIFL